jgi:hypothetical protein
MSTRTTDLRDDWTERRTLRGLETRQSEPIPSLLRRLADEVTTLFAQELALLKSETTHAIGHMKAAVASIAMGGAVMVLGLVFLLLSAVYGLSNVMEPWLAALIVGGVVTLIGAIMLMSGKKKLEPSAIAPRHTAASLRKDTEMIKGATQHEQR